MPTTASRCLAFLGVCCHWHWPVKAALQNFLLNEQNSSASRHIIHHAKRMKSNLKITSVISSPPGKKRIWSPLHSFHYSNLISNWLLGLRSLFITVFLNESSAEYRQLSRQKPLNKYKFWNTAKSSKYPQEMTWEFCPANFSNAVILVIYKLPRCYGQFIFKVMFSCTVSALVSSYHRASVPVVTKTFPAIASFRP
jgi:hypothetical protein